MAIAKVSDELSIAPQIDPAEIPALYEQGFRSIVSARPDDEEAGQPDAAEMRRAAEEAGMEYAHIPVKPGQIGDDDVARFAEAFDRLPKPVLGFCKSGNRAASLWALAHAGELPADELIARASGAGCDLSGLRDRLEAAAKA